MFYIPEIDDNNSVTMEETINQVNESIKINTKPRNNKSSKPRNNKSSKNSTDSKVIPYDHIAMETDKAIFLITDSTTDEGFWCPRSVIVNISDTDVTIYEWCTINLIIFA